MAKLTDYDLASLGVRETESGWRLMTITMGLVALFLGGVLFLTRGEQAQSEVRSTEYHVITSRDIYIDPMTGCHYLRPGTGGLYPRLRAEGGYFCESPKQQTNF